MIACHIYVLTFNIFLSIYPDTVYSVQELCPLIPLSTNYTSVSLNPRTIFHEKMLTASQELVHRKSE